MLTLADLPNGDYVLRLRAIDGNGLQGFDAMHRFTVFARPFPPGLNAPGDAATVRDARAKFAWTNVLDIERYRVQVARTSDFAELLYDETLSGEAWQTPEELPPGQLHWRAASIAADGKQGPWSVPATFIYKPGPGAVDVGRSALQIESETLNLKLPPPPDGLGYEAVRFFRQAAGIPPLGQASARRRAARAGAARGSALTISAFVSLIVPTTRRGRSPCRRSRSRRASCG
jgi:hypothetical protein